MRTNPLVITLLMLGLSGPATAADHGDGSIGLDVLQSLAEGPPYAAAPVEIGAVLRHVADPPLSAGELHLTLRNAEGGPANDPVALSGTAIDNGDAFGETGDTVTMDVYFVPGSPVDDLPDRSVLTWTLRPDPGSEGGPASLEFTASEPLNLGVDLFFQDYEVKARDVTTNALLGRARVRVRFDIAAGQGLEFDAVSSSPPDATGEVRLSTDLNQTAGGSVDTGEPLYRITISNEPIRALPLLPSAGLVLVAGGVLFAGIAGLHARRRRSDSSPLKKS
jgi:hypothetical protein